MTAAEEWLKANPEWSKLLDAPPGQLSPLYQSTVVVRSATMYATLGAGHHVIIDPDIREWLDTIDAASHMWDGMCSGADWDDDLAVFAEIMSLLPQRYVKIMEMTREYSAQREIAEVLDVSQPTLSRILRNIERTIAYLAKYIKDIRPIVRDSEIPEAVWLPGYSQAEYAKSIGRSQPYVSAMIKRYLNRLAINYPEHAETLRGRPSLMSGGVVAPHIREVHRKRVHVSTAGRKRSVGVHNNILVGQR